ncbi:hypothetical protein GCM10022260_19970 [Gaetbulibacter aestuarii]
MFLGNHQNALLDALLIAVSTKRFCYFLTRASVFQNKIATRALKSLQLIPIYRIRDGWSNLSNNAAIFENCTELLHNNEAIALFPEGNHNLNRTVRPLSKGFTRIIFETLERYPETDIKMIPVGVNYQKATAFGDSAAIFFGASFEAKSIISEDKNKSVLDLKVKVHEELINLTTHIPPDSYDTTLKILEKHRISYLNPKHVNDVISTNRITSEIKTVKKSFFIKHVFKWLLAMLLFGPYLVWHLLVKPKVASPEFIGTFRFAIGISLVPVWIIFGIILLTVYFNLAVGLLFFLVILTLDLLTVKI